MRVTISKKTAEVALYWLQCWECPNACPSGKCNDCKKFHAARNELDKAIRR